MSDKATLRRLMRERRDELDAGLGALLAQRLMASGLIKAGTELAGYWPIGSEIDIRPALLAAFTREDGVCLPVTPPRGEALSFRRWRPGAVMRTGRFGTFEPEGTLVVPCVMLVPLLAFDRAGGRLGYGGGYYDRTLAALRPGVFAIGCGFAAQEMDRVPMGTHDCRMDAIATEAGVFEVE